MTERLICSKERPMPKDGIRWEWTHPEAISQGDQDCGDWDEEIFDCPNCGRRIYVELPD